MPGAEAWQAFGGVVTVLIFLGGGAFALKRLGIVGARAAAAAPARGGPAEGDLADRVVGLERGLGDLRLHVAENYVRRDDYIPNESRVIGLLETHGVMLARLEERIGGGP